MSRDDLMTMYANMLELVQRAHASHKWDNLDLVKSYLHEVESEVKDMLPSTDEGVELRTIALGHLLIEDTFVTGSFLRDYGISETCVESISVITPSRSLSQHDYIKRLRANEHALFVAVAVARVNLRKDVLERDNRKILKSATTLVELESLKAFNESSSEADKSAKVFELKTNTSK